MPYSDPDFFVFGPPRSGTSLLTVLLSQHEDIAIAQDTSVFSEFKNALLAFEAFNSNNFKGFDEPSRSKLSPGGIEYVKNHPFSLRNPNEALLLMFYFKYLLRFYALDTVKYDPRKDRGTGFDYLEAIDFNELYRQLLSDPPVKMVSVFNQIIHQIIEGSGQTGKCLGEKTPSHIFISDLIADLYPDAKLVTIVRNPLTYIGSRRQRLREEPIAGHCSFLNSAIDCILDAPERNIIVRYEDLLSRPSEECQRIHRHLGLREIPVPEKLDPGVYPKYVGSNIDLERDKKNLEQIKPDEKQVILRECRGIFQRFYPEDLN